MIVQLRANLGKEEKVEARCKDSAILLLLFRHYQRNRCIAPFRCIRRYLCGLFTAQPSRSSHILFGKHNCKVCAARSQEDVIQFWSSRRAVLFTEIHKSIDEESEKTEKTNQQQQVIIPTRKKGKKKKEEEKKTGEYHARRAATNIALRLTSKLLSDLYHLIVTHSSMRMRLAVASMMGSFRATQDGRQVLIRNEAIVGRIISMGQWALE